MKTAVLRSRKYDICPTESKCNDYKVGGEKACSRCPKNLGYAHTNDENQWLKTDDTDLLLFDKWIAYLLDLYRRQHYFKIDESRLSMDEANGLLIVDQAAAEVEIIIRELREKEREKLARRMEEKHGKDHHNKS